MKKKEFQSWFENYFWYHYKWWLLVGVLVIAVIVFIGLEGAGKVEYDMTVVFLQDGELTDVQAHTVLESIAGSVGDLNGDGELRLDYVCASPGEQDRLMLCLTDEENALFFVTEALSETFCSNGYFEDALSDYGIETPEGDPLRVYVSGSEIFQAAGLQDANYYAHLIDWTTVGKGSREHTDAAIRAIRTLLDLY